ncbi:MAG: hypothetical protein JWN83_2160 [Chitinophagaceae bacterium]|nr:hypothetical protein [Chitinophagaceae bacterium]
MKTLFDPAINQEILDRVERLTPSSKPVWGKMSVEKMLAHLYLALQVNFGELKLNKSLLGIFFRGISRRILLGEKPFPKHLPADKKILPKEVAVFSIEKAKVEQIIKRYIESVESGLSKNSHNILGKISPQESSFISYKHLDHHLRQFGV